MKIVFTSRFRRSYERLVSRSEKLRLLVRERLFLFEENSKNPVLKDHALKGKLKGYRAFTVAYDLRVLYRKEREVCLFFDIGTHDAMYN